MSVQISIITLTWNSERYIERMIESVFRDSNLSDVKIEIIIVDNGSSDSTVELIKGLQENKSNLFLIELARNFGTTVTRNIGIKQSQGKFILILDSDTEVCPGILKGLIEAFKVIKSPNIGIIHPRLVFPNGELQESARRFPTLLTKIFRLFSWEGKRVSDESLPAVICGEIAIVDYAISAAWFMKRDLFDEIGFFDENIFFAPEDAEFCARCWTKGFEVWYYPKVKIVHHCQRITKKRIFSILAMKHLKGLLYFWWKYQLFLTREKIYQTTPLNRIIKR